MLDAAFRRCGVLRVNTIAELFYMAEVLAKQPRPRGPRLAIVTNAGGPGVLATDALVTAGRQLAQLSRETIEALQSTAAGALEPQQPVDILGDAGAERYAKAVEIAAKDPNSDGLLVILTPQAMTDPTPPPSSSNRSRSSWQTDPGELDGRRSRCGWRGDPQQRRHPDLPLSRHRRARLRLHVALQRQPAQPLRNAVPSALTPTRKRQAHARRGHHPNGARRRTMLTEVESKQMLAAYGIPAVETRVASSEEEAVEAAKSIAATRRAQALLRNDHAQDRRRRREVEPARRCSGPAGVSPNRASGQ